MTIENDSEKRDVETLFCPMCHMRLIADAASGKAGVFHCENASCEGLATFVVLAATEWPSLALAHVHISTISLAFAEAIVARADPGGEEYLKDRLSFLQTELVRTANTIKDEHGIDDGERGIGES